MEKDYDVHGSGASLRTGLASLRKGISTMSFFFLARRRDLGWFWFVVVNVAFEVVKTFVNTFKQLL